MRDAGSRSFPSGFLLPRSPSFLRWQLVACCDAASSPSLLDCRQQVCSNVRGEGSGTCPRRGSAVFLFLRAARRSLRAPRPERHEISIVLPRWGRKRSLGGRRRVAEGGWTDGHGTQSCGREDTCRVASRPFRSLGLVAFRSARSVFPTGRPLATRSPSLQHVRATLSPVHAPRL